MKTGTVRQKPTTPPTFLIVIDDNGGTVWIPTGISSSERQFLREGQRVSFDMTRENNCVKPTNLQEGPPLPEQPTAYVHTVRTAPWAYANRVPHTRLRKKPEPLAPVVKRPKPTQAEFDADIARKYNSDPPIPRCSVIKATADGYVTGDD